MSKNRVIVAMSGGVDSSVAAALLKEKGYEVIGVTMKIWGGETHDNREEKRERHACYGPGEREDIEDAKKVAQKLDIPLHVFDLKEEYKTFVLDYFRGEYMKGRTPNPCIKCNWMIKFGSLLKKAEDSGIEFKHFATGHYARVEYDKKLSRHILKRAKDSRKDQSYFLYALSQEQLRQCLFPLGELTKEEVRKKAHNLGLGIKDKPESQDFISGDYSSLLEFKPKLGPILNKDGDVLGEHKGIQSYTVGQRRGLGIAMGEPLYVIDIYKEKNAIVVGPKEALYKNELIASGLNWIAIKVLKEYMKVKARIRYRHKESLAELTPLDDGRVNVRFMEPQRAITPGQAVVFFDNDVVIGGGTIER